MTNASYATMLELGLAALEREADLDACVLERLRRRLETLVSADDVPTVSAAARI